MRFTRTTDAGTEPLTTAEAKLHLRVDGSDEDTLIDRQIKAARKRCESYTERSFITQTWKAYSDSFPDIIELLHGPVISVTSIEYIDEDGVTQTLDASDYTVDNISNVARIEPVDTWPSTKEIMNAVIVTYSCGYGSASNVPEDIKAAILLMIEKMYDTREETIRKMPTSAEYLLDSYKVYHTL